MKRKYRGIIEPSPVGTIGREYTKETVQYTDSKEIKTMFHTMLCRFLSAFLILLLSGDISTNPGPVKYPCGKCSKPVKRNQRGKFIVKTVHIGITLNVLTYR